MVVMFLADLPSADVICDTIFSIPEFFLVATSGVSLKLVVTPNAFLIPLLSGELASG